LANQRFDWPREASLYPIFNILHVKYEAGIQLFKISVKF